MVAIDNGIGISDAREGRANRVVLGAVAATALAGAAGAALEPVDGNGWVAAATMASRVPVLVFLAAMAVEPLSRLVPSAATRAAAAERGNLVLGFIAGAALSLLLQTAPGLFGDAPMADTTFAYCAVTGAILTVMFFASLPQTERILGGSGRRAMLRIGTAYFWTVFALAAVGHLVGPHRPDGWYGFSLLLLVAAVLLRFADAFRLHAGLAEKVA